MREALGFSSEDRYAQLVSRALLCPSYEMLSVGRELQIDHKPVVCRVCAWEGPGGELSTGLLQVTDTAIYFYAYRCPTCGSFDLTRKGKLLSFRLPAVISKTST